MLHSFLRKIIRPFFFGYWLQSDISSCRNGIILDKTIVGAALSTAKITIWFRSGWIETVYLPLLHLLASRLVRAKVQRNPSYHFSQRSAVEDARRCSLMRWVLTFLQDQVRTSTFLTCLCREGENNVDLNNLSK